MFKLKMFILKMFVFKAAIRAIECAVQMNLDSVEVRTDSTYTIKCKSILSFIISTLLLF